MISDEGLDYTPLLKCKRLQTVNTEWMRQNELNQEVCDKLEASGVELA
jgi:hypothetical protein